MDDGDILETCKIMPIFRSVCTDRTSDERLQVQARSACADGATCTIETGLRRQPNLRDVHQLRGENRDTETFDARLEQSATKLADTTLANTPLPLKSPRLATVTMSTVVPVSGQIYAGINSQRSNLFSRMQYGVLLPAGGFGCR